MTPTERALSIRAYVAEYLLERLLAEVFQSKPDPITEAKAFAQSTDEELYHVITPIRQNAAKSDAYSAEIRDAVHRIAERAIERLQHKPLNK